MYPVTAVFGESLRESHTLYVQVDAWYNGALLVEDLPINGGRVTVNSGTGVRRHLDLTISDASLWSKLNVVGVELRPYRGVRYPSGDVERVPLGVFGIDAQAMSVAPGGGIAIRSAPDRWARVQRARFLVPQSSVAGRLTVSEIARLVEQAVPGVTTRNLATSTATIGAMVWHRDRDKAAIDLATGIGSEVFFDVDGVPVIRGTPTLDQVPVWTVDASPTGVLLDGERIRDRSRTYNTVVVTAAATDGSPPFVPQIIQDTDPASPTYIGGPFGVVPYFWSSPAITSAAGAAAAATTIYSRVRAINAQLAIEAVVHPGLDRGDVIIVVTSSGVVERHLVDSLTVPLTVDGTQLITTRSSRPDDDLGEV